ncbi:hypothetical protein TYRP_011846 [Tyrophagus putrescentiae]|nr:hypothetical protein TYRP_011846 [Tyrophagus putrescentiae]
MAKIITSLAEDDTLAFLTLLSFGWRPRPHTGLKIIITTTRASVEPQDRRRPGWMAIRMEDDQDDRDERQEWMATRTDSDSDDDNDDDEDRKLKTEDRRRRGEEAGNRTVALPKRQSTLAVDLLKRSGPSRYYCPSSDVGGPKRTVDKDGRLSEDGEADG